MAKGKKSDRSELSSFVLPLPFFSCIMTVMHFITEIRHGIWGPFFLDKRLCEGTSTASAFETRAHKRRAQSSCRVFRKGLAVLRVEADIYIFTVDWVSQLILIMPVGRMLARFLCLSRWFFTSRFLERSPPLAAVDQDFTTSPDPPPGACPIRLPCHTSVHGTITCKMVRWFR